MTWRLSLSLSHRRRLSLLNGPHRPSVLLSKVHLSLPARRHSQSFLSNNSFDPHFTDIETEPQGTSPEVLPRSHSWDRGLGLGPSSWFWTLGFGALSGHRAHCWSLEDGLCRSYSAPLSNPARPGYEASQLPYQYWDDGIDFSGI